MRISPIVYRLRESNTMFEKRVFSILELEQIRHAPGIREDMAFVFQVLDRAEKNTSDASIGQTLTERFAVVIVLANDESQADKLGFLAGDKIHVARSQIFRALLGKRYRENTGPIMYLEGQLLPINPSYVWYQYDFEFDATITENVEEGYADIEGSELETAEQLMGLEIPNEAAPLKRMFTDYILSPSEDLPSTEDLPINGVDVSIPDMAQYIDESDDKNPGAFSRGFASGYDFYRILNRLNDPK